MRKPPRKNPDALLAVSPAGAKAIISQLSRAPDIDQLALRFILTFTGNQPSQVVIHEVFEECDQKWRGIGIIPLSGWRLKPEYSIYDAETRFSVYQIKPMESSKCIAGQILQGRKKPFECEAFGSECTPENPLGATMVSSQGACAAYYHYSDSILSETTEMNA